MLKSIIANLLLFVVSINLWSQTDSLIKENIQFKMFFKKINDISNTSDSLVKEINLIKENIQSEILKEINDTLNNVFKKSAQSEILKEIIYISSTLDSLKEEKHSNLSLSDITRGLTKQALIDKNVQLEYNINHFLNLKESWKNKYPIYNDLLNSKSYSKKIRVAGVLQILCGITGLIVTIVDANSEIAPETKVPGTKIKIPSIKNKWGKYHTVLTILSGSFVLSGVFFTF